MTSLIRSSSISMVFLFLRSRWIFFIHFVLVTNIFEARKKLENNNNRERMLTQVSKANQKAETPILFSAIHIILTASVNRNIFPGKKKKKKKKRAG